MILLLKKKPPLKSEETLKREPFLNSKNAQNFSFLYLNLREASFVKRDEILEDFLPYIDSI